MEYQIEVFCDNPNNANTYLISNETSCIVIDPANNIKILSKYIGERKLLGIFLTHGHYDHFKSLLELQKKYDVKIYMHKLAYLKLKNPEISCAKWFRYPYPTELDQDKVIMVHDGMEVKLNDLSVKCWHTPGHTDCMMSYIIDDNLFSGDFIFKGSIGRTDLPTSNQLTMQKMLSELKRRKINYIIYPGHEQSTSLDEEKKTNIFLKNIE